MDGEQRRQQLEDELKDASSWWEYLFPRPLRVALWVAAGLSAATGLGIDAAGLAPELDASAAAGANAAAAVVCAGALAAELRGGERRVARRAEARQRQLARDDRVVVVLDGAETTAPGPARERLRQVDDKWVLKRLERWAQQDQLPSIGPEKARLLQQLVRDKASGGGGVACVYEVGTFVGYSAIKLAQCVPEGARVVTVERDWRYALAAKRFMWQSNQGEREPGEPRVGERVTVKVGDAVRVLGSEPRDTRIDVLFLDGTPSQYLAYLKAAEPLLADGALVVADNAGVFAEGGLRDYLTYVRAEGGRYSSRSVETTLEWRDDVPDALEVSTFRGR